MKRTLLISVMILGLTTACSTSNPNSSQTGSNSNTSNTMENLAFANFSALPVKEFINEYAVSDYIMIDVRTAAEISEGKINSEALEIDFYAEDFQDQINQLDKNTKYLVYCQSGNRSGKTMTVMQDLGFNIAYHLEGGIMDYIEKGQ